MKSGSMLPIPRTKSGIKTRDTEDFFEYIGNPISGFRYKWSYYDKGMYDHFIALSIEYHVLYEQRNDERLTQGEILRGNSQK